MSTEQLLDEENKEPIDKKAFLDAQHQKQLKVFFIICAINVVLSVYSSTLASPTRLLNPGTIITSLMSHVVGLPILGAMLSLLFTCIPYKDFSYSERYIRTTLLTTIVLELFVGLMLLITVLYTSINLI